MTKIGIFWIHEGTAFGKAVSIDAGIEGVPGMVDSQDTHADVWERDRPWAKNRPALSAAEYQDVPRGRVPYLTKEKVHLVYADKRLMTVEGRLLIAKFFGFDADKSRWRSDVHYTTSKQDLDELFRDEFE